MINRPMKSMILVMVTIIYAVFAANVTLGDITFAVVPPNNSDYSVTTVSVGTNLWDVTIDGTGTEDVLINIFGTTTTDNIRTLRVVKREGTHSLKISIKDPSGSNNITNVTGLSTLGGIGASIVYDQFPFDLQDITLTGALTGTVRFNSLLGTIDVGDNINADIESLGDMNIIQANGYIRGRISTVPDGGGCNDTYGRIQQIVADFDKDGIGDLGAPGASNWLKIDYGSLITTSGQNTGNTGMELLRGANVYVDLNGTNGNDDVVGVGNLGGWFLHLETTASNGVFEGNFHVNRLTALANFAEDMIVNGDINANIMIDWLWTAKIQCQGNFNGSITTGALFYKRYMTAAVNHGLEIFGNLNGAICYGGHVFSNTCGLDGSDCTGTAWKADFDDTYKPVDSIEFPILIHGDIGSNGSLSMERTAILGSSDTSNSTLIMDRAPGGRDGRIVVDGNLLGSINITGDVEGQIEIFGSITNSGLLSIDGSLLTTSLTEGRIIVHGDVDGELDISNDVDGGNGTNCIVDVQGNVNGFINIGGSVLTNGELFFDAINPAGEVWIGKDLDGTIFISDNGTTNGLHGQIIINTIDDALSGWKTNGSVVIGSPPSVTLFGPKYAETPDMLGGGAVGEVRFMLHDEASEPVNNGSGSNLSVIKLRFYGPVKEFASPCALFPPVLVERWSGSTWVDVTSFMSYFFSPYDLTNGVFNTTLNIMPIGGGSISPGTYRISKTNNLVGDFGTMPAVRDFGTDGYYNVMIN